jgi:hypothetical protein
LPRKTAANNGELESDIQEGQSVPDKRDEIENLNRLLGAVLNYLSDDEVEVIDIEYLLNNTEGLQEWWDQYRERNRIQIEEEIKKSLGELSIEELESLREKIKGIDK